MGSRPKATALAALAALVAFAGPAVAPASAQVRASALKGVWGPTGAGSAPFVQQAKALGARRYLTTIRWAAVAPTRPANPRDPADPAYVWPEGFDATLTQLAAGGAKATVNLTSAPAWASGSVVDSTPPRDAADFADFAAAVAARYPAVAGWQIWSEPTKPANWAGLPAPTSPTRALTKAQRAAPEQYARILDASYAAIKAVAPRDEVIGGNTWTAGRVSPLQWIRFMRLPGGRRPRMDVYGHNPFSARAANPADDAITEGYADISDLDDLGRWLDRWQPKGRSGLRILLAEFSIPTDAPSVEFNFYVSARVQAKWTRAALRLVRRDRRIAGIAWVGLFDEVAGGASYTTGLIRADGTRKPAFAEFAKG